MKLVKATEQDFQRITQFYRDVIAHTEHMDTCARWVYGQHPTDAMIRRYIQADAMYCCEKDGSVIWSNHAVNALEQRGFSASVRTDQSHKFPALDGQTHIPERRTLKRGVRAVDVGQILYL